MSTGTKVIKNGATVNSAGEFHIEPPLSSPMKTSPLENAKEAAKLATKRFIDRYNEVYNNYELSSDVHMFLGLEFDWESKTNDYEYATKRLLLALASPEISTPIKSAMGEGSFNILLGMLENLQDFIQTCYRKELVAAYLDSEACDYTHGRSEAQQLYHFNFCAEKWGKELQKFNIDHPTK